MSQFSRRFRLSLLSLSSLLFLLPTTLAWLVNIEEAIRIQRPTWSFLEPLMPSALYQALLPFSADLSTITTFVPLLLLGFPFVMSLRILRFGEDADLRLRQLIYDPYPPHFPFFLVMLGLAGTLYGLLIGLDVSGVSALGEQGATPEHIQDTLDQLLGGTATALLSSLLGLAGAFLAARPLTWIFHCAARMPADEESLGLNETLQHLIGDMQSLGSASRGFGDQLAHTNIRDLPETLGAIQQELSGLREQLTSVTQHIDTLGQNQSTGQALLEPLGQLKELERLEQIESSLSQLDTTQNTSNEQQLKLITILVLTQQQQKEAAEQQERQFTRLQETLQNMEPLLRRSAENTSRHNELFHNGLTQLQEWKDVQVEVQKEARSQRDRMLEQLDAAQTDRNTDRGALRNAFGQFLQQNDLGKEDAQ